MTAQMTGTIGGGGMTARPEARRTVGGWLRLGGVVVAIAAIAAGVLVRFFIAGRQPLWLDETWTAAIAAEPTFGGFWRQVSLDVNAPLYYLVMHLWQAVFGLSDASLRLPGALFGAAAPLAAAFWGVKGLERPARLTWAALIAAWTPGIWLAGDARCYTLLILLSALQTLAFVRMLRRPALGPATAWCAISALAILTHYHAAIPTALEGAAYLAWARARAVRTWPAALLFAPVAAWLAFHLPRIAAFARPDIAWYRLLTVKRLGVLAAYPVGTEALGLTLVAIGGAAVVCYVVLLGQRRIAPAQPTLRLWLAVGVALCGAAFVVAMGFVRPSFTDRYLVPFVPGLLLGVVLIAQRLARRVPLTYAAVTIAAVGFAVPWTWTELRHGWRYYNWEQASADLMRGRPDKLVFVWDHPASQVLAPDQLTAVGGFFFRRAHVPVEVTTVVLDPKADPNPALVAAARGDRTALIWAYDRGVIGTAARWHLPRLATLDPSLICRNYGRGSVGVLACDRLGSVNTSRP
jgi:hypothetical protein